MEGHAGIADHLLNCVFLRLGLHASECKVCLRPNSGKHGLKSYVPSGARFVAIGRFSIHTHRERPPKNETAPAGGRVKEHNPPHHAEGLNRRIATPQRGMANALRLNVHTLIREQAGDQRQVTYLG
jgi:hypothetical protein